MKKKTNDLSDHIPPLAEQQQCDRCTNIGSRDFAGEWLCPQCVCDDVFEQMNERDN